MLNKYLKIFSIIIVAFIILFSQSLVFAEETPQATIIPDVDAASQTQDDISTISEDGGMALNQAINSTSSKFKQGDEYLSGNNITIDYPIDGNLYVIGSNVTINSIIGGDIFIMADQLKIENEASISGNLFSLTKTLDISGTVCDVYAISNSADISGDIYRDLRLIASDNVSISGKVDRNAIISGTSNLSINGMINGNLDYYSTQDANIGRENVGGDIHYQRIQESNGVTGKYIFLVHLFKLACNLALITIIWLLGLWIAPKFIKNSKELISKKTLKSGLVGLAGLIGTPIVAILLMLPIITIPISVILLILYAIAIVLGSSIFVISLNEFLSEKFNITNKFGKFIELLVTGTVIYVVELIPTVGSIISAIVLIIGIGIFLNHLFSKTKKTDDKKEDEQKQN